MNHVKFISDFQSNLSAYYSEDHGDLDVKISSGSPTVTTSMLDLSVPGSAIAYSAINNANFTTVGQIEFGFIPGYSGAPPVGAAAIFWAINNGGDYKNNMQLTHIETGQILLSIYDDTGVGIIGTTIATYSFTAGTYYKVVLKFDLVAGNTSLWINGAQQGATLTDTGTRINDSAYIGIGTDVFVGGPVYNNFLMDYIIIYDQIVDTSPFKNTVVVHSTIVDEEGLPQVGLIAGCNIKTGTIVVNTNTTVYSEPLTSTTNDSGCWCFRLIPTTSLEYKGVEPDYIFTIPVADGISVTRRRKLPYTTGKLIYKFEDLVE